MYYAVTRTDELQHHGIKGQKWGVRRYQNADGSLTSLGQAKYNRKEANKQYSKDYNDWYRHQKNFAITKKGKAKVAASDARFEKALDSAGKARNAALAYKSEKLKRKNAVNNARTEYAKAQNQYNKDFKDFYWKNKSVGITKKGKEKVKQSEKRFEKAMESAKKMNEAKAKVVMAKNPGMTLSEATKTVDRQNGAKAVGAALAYVGTLGLTVAYTVKHL